MKRGGAAILNSGLRIGSSGASERRLCVKSPARRIRRMTDYGTGKGRTGAAADLYDGLIRAALCRVARVPLARNRSADQWVGRLHVWPGAHVDAMGDRLPEPSIREFPGRLGSRAPLRRPGQLRLDMVDMRGARCIRGADPLVYPRAASRAPDTRSGAFMNSVSTDAKP